MAPALLVSPWAKEVTEDGSGVTPFRYRTV